MPLKDQPQPGLTYNLDDLTIGFDHIPLTKKEQKMISDFIKKDKSIRRNKKITNA